MKRNCPNGHPCTAETTFVKVTRKWNKTTGALREYRNRGCLRCQRQLQRMCARRRRATGKQMHYQQWLAAKGQGR